MIDLRPVFYVIGWLVAALGLSMVLPLALDLADGDANWRSFATSALLTILIGGLTVLACAQRQSRGLSLQQSFLFATGVWVFFPIFGALPMMLGAPGASAADAIFEAMSALTTTGSSVIADLEALPRGTLLWRGLMQWYGGIGIIVVAMVFLPTLKIGGMQLFRSEAFDTLGKILPRAVEIAISISWIYLAISLFCCVGYLWSGMSFFDAVVHTMTTVSTGGMANYNASFGAFSPSAQYVSTLFMVLAALPFVRYVQLVAGSAEPLYRDSQVRAFFVIMASFVGFLTVWLALTAEAPREEQFRLALFNVISIGTGTGFASTDYTLWGSLAVTLFFILGLIGGCSGSTTCSVKVFRYQLVFSAVVAEVNRLHSPNRVFTPRYEGRPVPDDVMNSLTAFFMMFFLCFGIMSVLLVMIGLDPITAISAAATAIANVGPGLGPEIGPVGNFAGLPDSAKWLLTVGMMLGRLELLTVLVIFTPAFWRT